MSETYTAPCPHFRKCGGCQLQNLPYPQQLRRKQKQVEELLGEFAPVLPILGMEEPSHYRNKVHAAFALDGRRQIVSGIYQPGSHAIVPVDSCYIEDETADAIIRDIRGILRNLFREQAGQEEVISVPLLHHLLPATHIQLDVECEDWKEAIRAAAMPLHEMGYIEERYITEVIRNVEENGPYIVISLRKIRRNERDCPVRFFI